MIQCHLNVKMSILLKLNNVPSFIAMSCETDEADLKSVKYLIISEIFYQLIKDYDQGMLFLFRRYDNYQDTRYCN